MNSSRLIAVDIGNTSTKVGWFENLQTSPSTLPALAATYSFPTGQTPSAEIAASLPDENRRWHIVSVNRDGTRLLTEWLQTHRPADEIRVLGYRDLPIEVEVDSPERVGLDRLAAAVATNVLREYGRPAIVIDAGSAITVDLVTAQGAFAGGTILPGFRMSSEALYGGADLLPLAVLAVNDEPPPVLGKNTEAAIQSGLFWGAVGAVREIATLLSANLDQSPHIFVTGGDLRQLAKQLSDDAVFVSNLVLCGIAIADRRC